MYVVGGVSGGEGAVVQGNWNKESMIRKVLQDTPPSAADWVLWLDVDTVLPQAGMLPRFDQYGGRDLVVWGDAAKLDAGNMNGGKRRSAPLSLCILPISSSSRVDPTAHHMPHVLNVRDASVRAWTRA